MKKHHRGFTLIELLIVLTILGLAASLVGPFTARQLDKIKVVKERQQLFSLLEDIAFNSFLNRTGATVELTEQRLVVQWPTETADYQFAILSFPNQRFTVNSHGFWQVKEVRWNANEQQGQLTLSSEDALLGRSTLTSGINNE